MSLRLGGIAAAIGGVLWLAGLLWGTFDRADEDPGAAVMLLGTLALLVGLTGLSAFQARRHPLLVWTAFALPAFGGAMLTLGLLIMAAVGDRPVLGGLYGWGLFIIGLLATIAGSALFAIATYRTAALPRSGAVILGITAAISIVTFVVASTLKESGPPVLMVGLGAFAVGWVVMGLQAIRLDRPVLAASPA